MGGAGTAVCQVSCLLVRVYLIAMLSEPPIVLKPNTTYSLHITAKRYRPDRISDNPQPGAITLILLHATSLHKETWEPTLKRVFDMVTNGRHARVNIREAWAIECPNHGESAQLNEAELQEGQQHYCNCEGTLFVLCDFLLRLTLS